MKPTISILSATLLVLASTTLTRAQDTPKPSASPAASAASIARTDVYLVNFSKATPGKAIELLDYLKTPDAKAPMPGHRVIFRHQEGDAWDYCAIEHLGTKATLDAAGNLAP